MTFIYDDCGRPSGECPLLDIQVQSWSICQRDPLRYGGDGTEQQRVLGRASESAFLPDGQRLAFVSDRAKNGSLDYGDREFFANELYVTGVDGGHRRRLTKTRGLNEARPSWLPEGTRLAFQRGEQIGNAEGMSLFQIIPTEAVRGRSSPTPSSIRGTRAHRGDPACLGEAAGRLTVDRPLAGLGLASHVISGSSVRYQFSGVGSL